MNNLDDFEPYIQDFKKFSENLFNDENVNMYSEIKEELSLHKKYDDIWERNNFPGRVD